MHLRNLLPTTARASTRCAITDYEPRVLQEGTQPHHPTAQRFSSTSRASAAAPSVVVHKRNSTLVAGRRQLQAQVRRPALLGAPASGVRRCVYKDGPTPSLGAVKA